MADSGVLNYLLVWSMRLAEIPDFREELGSEAC